MKTLTTILLITLFIWHCQPEQKTEITFDNNTAEMLADNFIKLFPDSIHYPLSKKKFKWDYEQGLVLEAFYRLWKKTGNQKYFDYITKNINYVKPPSINNLNALFFCMLQCTDGLCHNGYL